MVNIPGKPFTDVLGEMENGQLLYDLTEALYNTMAAVMDTRKAGGISLNITITPTGKGTVNVTGTFKSKEPEHTRSATTFFVGKDFSLQRGDPNQHKLPLREVETPSNEPVDVDAASA
jgi:hypothetical protein